MVTVVGDFMSGENMAIVILLKENYFSGDFYELSQFGILNNVENNIELTLKQLKEFEEVAKIVKIDRIEPKFIIATSVS